MPLIILLYFLRVQHVSGTTMPIIRSLRFVSFCKDGGVSVSVNLWLLVLCVFGVRTNNHKFTLTLAPPSLQNETTNVVINIIVASS